MRCLFVSILGPILVLLTGCAGSQTEALNTPRTTADPSVGKKQLGVPHTRLANCRRIVFLGDSITYSGQYVDYLEMGLRRLAPKSEFEFLDLGLPSETLSGLSEPGHAGGTFPRPNLHERLERLLEMTRPDLVIACYGMNDGIYHPFSQERFDAFQRGILLLRDRVLSSGAKIIHLTPPVFDAVPIRKNTLPAGRAEYRQPFEGYDTVLTQYSQWLESNRKKGWEVIDVHSPMIRFLETQRSQNAAFHLASDGVHLNDNGHWLIAHTLFDQLRARVVADQLSLDLDSGKIKGKGIVSSGKINHELSFVWRTSPPLPLPLGKPKAVSRDGIEGMPLWGQEHGFVATRAKAARYELFESERLLATLSREQLAAGIDTRQFPQLLTTARGSEMLQLIHKRNRTLSDSWLTTTGHKRPGMQKGLPVNEAIAQAEVLNSKIKELNQPVELQFRLVPVLEAR
jgi:lysophospholipase L1-like esterase